jgi:outer membrane protein TolC
MQGSAVVRAAWALVWVGGGVALPGVAQQAPVDSVVTLADAVRLAWLASPTIAAADGGVRTARAAQRSATGAFLPTVGVSSQVLNSDQFTAAGTSTIPAGTSTQTCYSASVNGSLELFDGGRRFAGSRAAKANRQAADAGLVRDRYAIGLSAKQAFFDVLRADQLVAVAAARIRQAERSRDIAKSRRDAGTATRSDELRAELELNTARQSMLVAQEQRQTATLVLGRLIGADGPVGALADTASLEPRPLPLARGELESLAAASSPQVTFAQERSRASAAGVAQARSQWLPSIVAGAGYNVANTVSIAGALRDGYAVQLGLTYPLFNGFKREEQVTQAVVAADIAKVTAADAVRAARADAGRLAGSVAIAADRVALAHAAVGVAEEDLRVIEARYRVGASSILDLVTSQVNLVQARTDLVTSRYDYLIARAGLEAVVGRDLGEVR